MNFKYLELYKIDPLTDNNIQEIDSSLIKKEMRRWRTNKTYWIILFKILIVLLLCILLWKLTPKVS